MAHHKLFLTFIIIFVIKTNCNKIQNICATSKCFCEQNSNNFRNIPLFKIDCSRLDYEESPSENILPSLLGHLDLSHNKITSLNRTNQISSSTLYYLDYSHNKIKHISADFFSNLTELRHLNLANNKLGNIISFRELPKLKVLDLQWNKFTKIPDFTSLNSLKDLTLSYNNIGGFLENNILSDYVPSSVDSIFLERINLTKLSANIFQEMKHLKVLSIAYNPIENISYLRLNHLEYLDISGINISNITAGDLMFHYLKTLKMNRLINLKRIDEYTFYNLQNLKELYMEHCVNLQEIDSLAFGYVKQTNTTRNFTIEKFSVAYSGLITLPKNFQIIFANMREIHLKGNFWQCDCNLSWFKHLKKNVKDINQIRCNSPESEANKTVHEITENLTCVEVKKLKSPSPYRPTQTYLFPVVGVLAIIVIILVSILVYMGPNKYGTSKMRHIGPDSPYNPITIQPNQAEYYFNNNHIHTVA